MTKFENLRKFKYNIFTVSRFCNLVAYVKLPLYYRLIFVPMYRYNARLFGFNYDRRLQNILIDLVLDSKKT